METKNKGCNMEYEGKKYLSIPELSKTLKISDRTARNWVLFGNINSIQIGNRSFIPETEINRLLGDVKSHPLNEKTQLRKRIEELEKKLQDAVDENCKLLPANTELSKKITELLTENEKLNRFLMDKKNHVE